MRFGFLGLKNCGGTIKKYVRGLTEDEGGFKFLQLNFL